MTEQRTKGTEETYAEAAARLLRRLDERAKKASGVSPEPIHIGLVPAEKPEAEQPGRNGAHASGNAVIGTQYLADNGNEMQARRREGDEHAPASAGGDRAWE